MNLDNGVEILVHNISHSDLVLCINNLERSLAADASIARPKFSHFREITEKILLNVESTINTPSDNSAGLAISHYPKHYRNGNSLNIKYGLTSDMNNEIPVGFNLRDTPVFIDNMASLRFRRDDANLCLPTHSDSKNVSCNIDAAYFPLVSILISKWLEMLQNASKSNALKIIVLISGRGHSDELSSDDIDNSTKFTGQLITYFIHSQYPDIKIVHIHSTINLFRYDENVVFVKRELMPLIDSYRNALAEKMGGKWKDALHIALSFADGSSARISAIQAALRYYRPDYFHFWQLKTFWSETKICEDDIECHSYEVIATDPAVSVSCADANVQLLVAEMEKFIGDLNNAYTGNVGDNDLSSFWHRKTGKPVLAVLLVQKPGQDPKLFRGTNMEVSMPTGSLCAERNVIGSALAADLTLKRQDLKMIAVYSATSLQQRDGILSRNASLETTCTSSGNSTPRIKPLELNASKAEAAKLQSSLKPQYPSEVLGTKIRNRSLSFSVEVPSFSISNSGLQLQTPSCYIDADPDALTVSTPLSSHSSHGSATSPSGASTAGVGAGQKRKIMHYVSNSSKAVDSILVHANGIIPTPQSQASKGTMPLSSKKSRLLRNKYQSIPSSLISEVNPDSEKGDPISFHQGDLCVIIGNDSIVVDDSDLNPLKPCGACNEWLKKIAEVNPQFAVVTFTDTTCAGVYVDNICE